MTFMDAKDTEQPAEPHPREDDRNDELEGSPIPDPEEERGTAQDDPQAD
jgi:hypothetical protein